MQYIAHTTFSNGDPQPIAAIIDAADTTGVYGLAHSHHHGSEATLKRAFALIAGFMIIEAVGGWLANSLTLIADAGHMFLDATALGLAWYAAHLSHNSGNQALSYGYHRAQVLAAFVNGLTLAALVLFILWEALQRLQNPEPMQALPALGIAVLGLAVNIVAFYMLHTGEKNMNVRAAMLHVIGDMLGSAAAIAAALTVYLTGWLYADPLLAGIIALVLGRGAYRVLKESGHILLEGVPADVDIAEIRATLEAGVPGVRQVHHVHAWSLTPDKPLLTLHASVDENVDIGGATTQMKDILKRRFGIDHSTIQVEPGHCPDH